MTKFKPVTPGQGGAFEAPALLASSLGDALAGGMAEDAAATGERRGKPRFAQLMRSAKLVSKAGEFLCIVRDVSPAGLKLRLFHKLPPLEDFAIELVGGERCVIELTWEHEGEAGFRFVQGVEVDAFLAATGPFPKRPLRLRVDHDVTLRFGDETFVAKLGDLSRQGAGIETDRRLAVGQKLVVEGEGLPSFDATVCWRREPAYGLVFRQLMGLEELALRVYAMRCPATGLFAG